MFEGTDSVFNTEFPQTFLTNPSKLRIYLCKIPAVITETLIEPGLRLSLRTNRLCSMESILLRLK
jgi:hypothetical protein